MFPKPSNLPHAISSYRPSQLTSHSAKHLKKSLLTAYTTTSKNTTSFRSIKLDFALNIASTTWSQTTSVPSCLVLFDPEKALDKVWNQALIFRLRFFQLPIIYICFIHNFLTNRLAHISINSISASYTAAFRKDLLYLLFIADLSPNIHIFQYTEDTAFLALSKSVQHINRTMNQAINTFTSWCSKWGLTINSNKTQAIVFILPKRRSRVKRNPSCLDIKVLNERIKPTNKLTYLGLIIGHHITCGLIS